MNLLRPTLPALAISLLAAPSWSQGAQDSAFGSPSHFTENSGAAIYQGVCAGCHMANGSGASGAGAYPALAHDPRLAAAGYPIGVVLKGQKAMPAFGRLLTDAQVAEVVNYIRHRFDNDHDGVVSGEDVHNAR